MANKIQVFENSEFGESETANQLIPINFENENPTVSGRELHSALEVETPYHKWFPRMREYGFTDGKDFNLDKFVQVQKEGNREVSREIIDHALTISMAKEICMLQRNEKGKMFRQYFIQVEEAWNTPEMVMSRALKFAQSKICLLETKAAELTETNQTLLIETTSQKQLIGELKPKADYVDYILSGTGALTTTQIAADYGISAIRLNKILKDEGIQRNVGGQWVLYVCYMNKGYTKSETFSFKHKNGNPDIKVHTKWTQKGRLLINKILNKQGIYANMDIVSRNPVKEE